VGNIASCTTLGCSKGLFLCSENFPDDGFQTIVIRSENIFRYDFWKLFSLFFNHTATVACHPRSLKAVTGRFLVGEGKQALPEGAGYFPISPNDRSKKRFSDSLSEYGFMIYCSGMESFYQLRDDHNRHHGCISKGTPGMETKMVLPCRPAAGYAFQTTFLWLSRSCWGYWYNPQEGSLLPVQPGTLFPRRENKLSTSLYASSLNTRLLPKNSHKAALVISSFVGPIPPEIKQPRSAPRLPEKLPGFVPWNRLWL